MKTENSTVNVILSKINRQIEDYEANHEHAVKASHDEARRFWAGSTHALRMLKRGIYELEATNAQR